MKNNQTGTDSKTSLYRIPGLYVNECPIYDSRERKLFLNYTPRFDQSRDKSPIFYNSYQNERKRNSNDSINSKHSMTFIPPKNSTDKNKASSNISYQEDQIFIKKFPRRHLRKAQNIIQRKNISVSPSSVQYKNINKDLLKKANELLSTKLY